MSRFSQIFNKVLLEITPTQQEIQVIDKIVKELERYLKQRAIELDIKYTTMEPQGSTGIKQTQLKDDFDVDFFIGLDINQFEDKHKELSKNKLKEESKHYFLHLCNEWIIKSLKGSKFMQPNLFYAEHPYVRAIYVSDGKEIQVDIVLYLDLSLKYVKENGPITSVDRSPWHGRFIRDNLTVDQKNDVRLLKQFFKACHCYGDKSAVGRMGFIGYSAELLIYYYKSLESLFLDFNNLPSKYLDFYERSKNQLMKIAHMREDPLVIIDPIDKNRNVASAISLRAYKYCNHKISQFIQNPKVEYFQILPLKELIIDENHPLYAKTFIIDLKNDQVDVHYTINRDKLYSLAESIKSNGEREVSHDKRFGSIEFELYFEESTQEYNLAFYCEQPSISRTFLRKGPPLKDKLHVERFKEKNPDYIEKDMHLWVETVREFTEFVEFLESQVSEKLPDNFSLIKVAQSPNIKTESAKKALYVLIYMVLPFLKPSE
jgi:tRNA nucleotidyltransferase (CCA-adding enzyme)